MPHVLKTVLIACAAFVLGGIQCMAAPVPGTVARTLEVGTLSRTYYLHVPSNLPKDMAVPLVLMFHGGSGTPAFAERESKFSELADREHFLVAYPEGIGKSWNDGRGVQAIKAQRDEVDDLAFISALLDDVAKDYKVDPRRVFSTGISNGAIFSHYLAANRSSRIAAIAPVVGGLPEPSSVHFKPEQPVSVLILQGTDDPLVPYNGGDVTPPGVGKRGKIVATDEAVRQWVAHNACRREPVTEDLMDTNAADGCRVKKFTYAKGKDGTEVVLYRMAGAGHAWPDGLQYLPEKIIGKVCRDFDGAAVIWEFFKAHPKP
ncbi:MAG: hypothetical protein L0Y32_05635 [Nevskiales bacterium]|nr:hypothetical protein [Nevskiales bacterium]